MASVLKRGDSYRAQVKLGGKRFTKTFKTRAHAREWATRKELQLKAMVTGELGQNKTVSDAFDKYVREVSPTKKGSRWELIRLEALKEFPLAKVPLDALKPLDVAEWRDARLRKVSSATVRREINLMSAVFKICVMEWNWLTENPVSYVKRPPNSKARDRRISLEETKKIKAELGYDIGTKITTKKGLVGAFFLLGIETGMRLGEMCGLRAGDMFMDQCFVCLRDTKNGMSRNVALSKNARLVLADVTASGLHVASGVASSTFRKAMRTLDIKDLHFHDTRHEATTRLSKKLEIMDLARMLGHRDLRSLLVYYNATAAEIAAQLD